MSAAGGGSLCYALSSMLDERTRTNLSTNCPAGQFVDKFVRTLMVFSLAATVMTGPAAAASLDLAAPAQPPRRSLDLDIFAPALGPATTPLTLRFGDGGGRAGPFWAQALSATLTGLAAITSMGPERWTPKGARGFLQGYGRPGGEPRAPEPVKGIIANP